VLQSVAKCCSLPQSAAVSRIALHFMTHLAHTSGMRGVCCNVLQCVAVCCRAMQSAAVCCSKSHCIALYDASSTHIRNAWWITAANHFRSQSDEFIPERCCTAQGGCQGPQWLGGHLYVYVYIYICIYIYICVCVCVCSYEHTHILTHNHTPPHTPPHTHIPVPKSPMAGRSSLSLTLPNGWEVISFSLSICIYIHIYIYVYVYVCVCMTTHTHKQARVCI